MYILSIIHSTLLCHCKEPLSGHLFSPPTVNSPKQLPVLLLSNLQNRHLSSATTCIIHRVAPFYFQNCL